MTTTMTTMTTDAPATTLARDWTRDETLLALALYRRIGAAPDENDHDVIALSVTLRTLAGFPADKSHRSAEAVSMKLRTFLALDDSADASGLANVGTLVREVFATFAGRDADLMAEVTRIVGHVAPVAPRTDSVTPVVGLRVRDVDTDMPGRVTFARDGFPCVVVTWKDGRRTKHARADFVMVETGASFVIGSGA
jgi:hypothetical protein